MVVLARHLVLDEEMKGEAMIVVTDMVKEGRVLEFEGRLTGGLPEIMVGPATYDGLTEEDFQWR